MTSQTQGKADSASKPTASTTAATLLVKCLENEGVEYIFGIPGEENIDIMDALLDSKIKFVTTRHEQGAAFMAEVYGRLTGRAGVCLNLVDLFQPISKYATQILEPEIVPEVVRKAFKVAQTETPGGAFIDFPENIAEAKVESKPIKVQMAYTSAPPDLMIDRGSCLLFK